MSELKKNIVLGGDFNYITQIITTLKSILYNNKNVNIFLMHNDIPSEWFMQINKQLAPLQPHAQLHEINVTNSKIKNYKTWEHISYATFFRYFIPQYISQNRVLYLDCDLVVTGSLDEFYSFDFKDNYVAAVEDNIAKIYYNRSEFNAGVLLINNKLWRQEQIMQKALKVQRKYDKFLNDADQSVLNILFGNRWLKLSNHYNYLTGFHFLISTSQFILRDKTLLSKPKDKPLIIHYNTSGKPWCDNVCDIHYRSEWWFYHNLQWQEIYKVAT